MKNISIYMLGAGGHTKVLLDCLRFQKNITVLGILDIDQKCIGHSILGVPVVGEEDEILKNHSPNAIQLVNGIGSTGLTAQREFIFNKFKNFGFQFFNVIHPTAYIGSDVILGEGVQLMASCIIQPGSRIGSNVIVNTNASIDHDCDIADHAHIAPGVICCGEVTIGYRAHIGSGAIVKQGITIGEQSLIAAGAVVIRDIISRSKVAGVPA